MYCFFTFKPKKRELYNEKSMILPDKQSARVGKRPVFGCVKAPNNG